MKKGNRLAAGLLCGALLLTSVPGAFAAGELTELADSSMMLEPTGVTRLSNGALLAVDEGNNCLYELDGGSITRYAGKTLPNGADGTPTGGHLDGKTENALFDEPFAAVEWNGGVAVSDQGNSCIRFIRDGKVQTLAGGTGTGKRDGAAASAQFDRPRGLAVDSRGVLYIADSGNGSIRTLTAKGTVSTLVSGLSEPTALAFAGDTLYVTDTGTHRILRVVNGKAEVYAGASQQDGDGYVGGFADGSLENAQFSVPSGLAVVNGTIYVADTGNAAIRRISDGWVSTLAAFNDRDNLLYPGSPCGIAADGDMLVIADAFSGTLLRLDPGKQIFSDIGVSDSLARAVSDLYTREIIAGVSIDRFAPAERCTRGQAVTILHRAAGLPDETQSTAFADVLPNFYYTDAVNWAAKNGIVTGETAQRFAPDGLVTREQLAAILCRYVGASEDADASFAGWPDASEVSDYARIPMRWAVRNGVLTCTDKLAPKAPVTRGELAQAIFAVLHLNETE